MPSTVSGEAKLLITKGLRLLAIRDDRNRSVSSVSGVWAGHVMAETHWCSGPTSGEAVSPDQLDRHEARRKLRASDFRNLFCRAVHELGVARCTAALAGLRMPIRFRRAADKTPYSSC
jgi:hypothetical protein